jgi:YbbR domain-containing protein
MRRAFRTLSDNLGSAVLALLLAFIIWITATLQSDAFINQVVSNVPVTVIHQAPDTRLFEPIIERVSVEVRAPESVARDLTASEFYATLDLAAVQPAQPLAVPVVVTTTNGLVRIQGVVPSEETIHLELERTITFPVSLAVEGNVAVGYQASFPKIMPAYVTLTGSQPYLSQVVSVTAAVNIEGAKSDITVQAPVTPRDAGGKSVTDVDFTPEQVEVQVSITQRVGYKPDVEVVPDLRVVPAPGYRLGSVSVTPSVVTLKGPPSVLDSLPGFVKTLPISVTDATQNLTQRTALTLPDNVAVIDVDYVTVFVEVLPIQSSRTLTATVEVQGVPSGWTAAVSPNVVDVIIEGPDSIVSSLLPGDIQILLNLGDYSLGIYRVTPIVLAPEQVTVVSVIPETVEVSIQALPTPTVVTPTLTITSTLPPPTSTLLPPTPTLPLPTSTLPPPTVQP